MSSQNDYIVADCPLCEADVLFRQLPRLNERIICRDCGARLEVVRRVPLELEAADSSKKSRKEEKRHDYELRRLRRAGNGFDDGDDDDDD